MGVTVSAAIGKPGQSANVSPEMLERKTVEKVRNFKTHSGICEKKVSSVFPMTGKLRVVSSCQNLKNVDLFSSQEVETIVQALVMTPETGGPVHKVAEITQERPDEPMQESALPDSGRGWWAESFMTLHDDPLAVEGHESGPLHFHHWLSLCRSNVCGVCV